MRQAVPDCMVFGFEDLIEGIELPDPDDRHVLAAAIRAGAQAIVTFKASVSDAEYGYATFAVDVLTIPVRYREPRLAEIPYGS